MSECEYEEDEEDKEDEEEVFDDSEDIFKEVIKAKEVRIVKEVMRSDGL